MRLLKAFIVSGVIGAVLCGLNITLTNDTKYPSLFSGTLLEAAYIPTPVKSINHINITVPNLSSSNTQTVTAVNTGSTVINATGLQVGSATPAAGMLLGTITNSTTITATRIATSGSTIFTGELIEFAAGFVKSKNCSNIDIADAAASGTYSGFTAVNTAKTLVFYTGANSTDNTSLTITQDKTVSLVLTSSTVITATRSSSTGELNVGVCYLEFK